MPGPSLRFRREGGRYIGACTGRGIQDVVVPPAGKSRKKQETPGYVDTNPIKETPGNVDRLLRGERQKTAEIKEIRGN